METVIIQNDTVIVEGITYQSPSFNTMLQILGISELPITSAEIRPDPDILDNFYILGNTTIFSQPLEGVTLYFDVTSQNGFNFQFASRFPTLSLSTLVAQNLFPIHPNNNIQALLAAPFANVEFIFDSQADELYVSVLNSSQTFTFLNDFGWTLENIGFEFLRGYQNNHTDAYLFAQMNVGSTTIDTTITLPLSNLLSSDNWILQLTSTTQITSGLQSVAAFLTNTQVGQQLGVTTFANLFPAQLLQISNIFLDGLEIQFNPVTRAIDLIFFRVESLASFTTGNGLFSIDNVGLTMTINLQSTSPYYSLTLFGSIHLEDDIFVDITLFIPENQNEDWVFQVDGVVDLGHINLLNNLRIGTSVAAFALPTGFLSETQLRLNLFDVYFNPTQGTVPQIDLDLLFFVDIPLFYDLHLQNPALSLNVRNPFNQPALDTRQIDGAISAVLEVGNITFGIQASKENERWSFAGNVESGSIPIGQLIDVMGQQFNIQMPNFVHSLLLEELSLSFTTTAVSSDTPPNTVTQTLTFTSTGSFPIASGDVQMMLAITIQQAVNNDFTSTINGRITIADLQFDLHFVNEAASDYFIATYRHSDDVRPLMVHDLVNAIAPDVANYIPTSLQIDLKDILFGYRRTDDSEAQFIFGLDIGTGFNLSQLPLVGTLIANDQTISVNNLQIVVASSAIAPQTVTLFNSLLPNGVTPLPNQTLATGINITAMINFGGSMELLNLPIRGGTETPPPPAPPLPGAVPVTTANNAKWYSLQKSFGPVHFERVGIEYQNSALLFLLDASLSAAGLTLTLDGLGFGASLDPFTPHFDLKGLGIDYQNGPLAIGGAFLRQMIALPTGEIVDEYDGAAVVSTTTLTLSAIGSYARVDGHPALFIYAVLDYPLGGPAFFFVTGLAAGFGYNRSLNIPPIERVADFALVHEAVSVSNGTTPSTLADTLNSLRQDIPIAIGQNFLAVGIKFSSFKLIDSFVLVTLSFGRRFELDILGLSTLTVPSSLVGDAITPLAEVQMALKASFIPDDGFLGVSAQLTDASYILSRSCHLTGGFAFYTWFSGQQAGEFVQTLGGYHPNFQIPAHYPRLPRLGLNWHINDELNIKGDAYYALTPAILMAGGRLEATWRSGDLKACFVATADFLLAWQPYHYEAHLFVDILVKYTFRFFGTHHISAHVSADLQIWGPEFSGIAHVTLSVVSFDVRFGQARQQRPSSISWAAFQNAFLPTSADDISTLTVQTGLIRDGDNDVDWVLNPQGFTLATDAVIPSAEAYLGTTPIDLTTSDHRTDFGISSMAVTAAALTTQQTITITRDGASVEAEFALTPILKSVPAGLWGQSPTPTLNGPSVITNTLAGFSIRPQNPPIPGVTAAVDNGRFQFNTIPQDDVYTWQLLPNFTAQELSETDRRQTIRDDILDPTTQTTRDQLLSALGITAEIALTPAIANSFIIAPEIAA